MHGQKSKSLFCKFLRFSFPSLEQKLDNEHYEKWSGLGSRLFNEDNLLLLIQNHNGIFKNFYRFFFLAPDEKWSELCSRSNNENHSLLLSRIATELLDCDFCLI